MFGNAVDRMDQRRSTNLLQGCEKEIGMSIFKMVYVPGIHDANMLYQNRFERGKLPEGHGY